MSTKSSRKTTLQKTSAESKKQQRTKTICVSHKEDADGISSAALIKQAFGGDCVLVDYPGMVDALELLRNDKKLKKLFICDLGLNKQINDNFVELLTELRKKRVSVTYIDHHDIDSKVITKLKKIKVKLIHNISECTSVLVYDTFKKKLSEHSSFIAACGAITDYIEGHQKDPDYLLYLVEELSESNFPHEIPNTYEFAQIQVGKLAEIMSKVRKSMKVSKNLAHMEVLDSGASGAVNFVLGFSGKDVGVAYKERVDKGIYAVSVRGSPSCKTHLGRLVSSVAADLGGSGGGHDRACGAVIPKEKMKKFLREMNSKLG